MLSLGRTLYKIIDDTSITMDVDSMFVERNTNNTSFAMHTHVYRQASALSVQPPSYMQCLQDGDGTLRRHNKDCMGIQTKKR